MQIKEDLNRLKEYCNEQIVMTEKFDEKFLKKRFTPLILDIYGYSHVKQKEILINTLNDWRGKIEQVNDITLFGLII